MARLHALVRILREGLNWPDLQPCSDWQVLPAGWRQQKVLSNAAGQLRGHRAPLTREGA